MNTGNALAVTIPVASESLKSLHGSLITAKNQVFAARNACQNNVAGKRAVYAISTELGNTIEILAGLLEQDDVQTTKSETSTVPTSLGPEARVFGILELLEMIFQHLDLFDLLSAMQISSITADLPRESSRIRKIMCL